jgi:hypothetical protein
VIARSRVSARRCESTADLSIVAFACDVCVCVCLCLCCACARAEPIIVRVAVVNRLLVDVTVHKVQLRCVHTPPPPPAGADDSKSGTPPTAAPAAPVASGSGSSEIDLDCDVQSIALPANSARWVECRVVCRREGTLRIEGVSWELFDVVQGFHRFALPDRHLSQKKGRRRLLRSLPNTSLVVPITAPLPLLSFEFLQFPSALLHGEVVYAGLRLVNFGQIALDELAVKISHPAFFAMPKAAHREQSSAAAGLAAAAAATGIDSKAGGGAVYEYDWKTGAIDLGLQLEPGESVVLPLWIRGAVVGEHNIALLFRYQARKAGAGAGADSAASPRKSPMAGAASAFRVAHLQRTVSVQPLLHVRVFNRPCFSRLQESVLGLEVERVAADAQPNGLSHAAGAPAAAAASSLSAFSAAADFKQNDAVPLIIAQAAVNSRAWQIAPLRASGAAAAAAPAVPPPLLPSYVSPSLPLNLSIPALSGGAGAAAPAAIDPSAVVPLPVSTLQAGESNTLYFRISNLPLPSPPSAAVGGAAAAAGGAAGSAAPTPAAAPSPFKPVWKDVPLQPQHHTTAVMSTVDFVPSAVTLTLPSGSATATPAATPATAAGAAGGAAASSSSSSSAASVISSSVSVRADSAPFRGLLALEKELMIEAEAERVLLNPAAVVAHVNASDKLDAVLSWTTADRRRVGFHFLPGLSCMKTPASACALKVMVHYPRRITHDFTRG